MNEIERRDRQVTGGNIPNPAVFGERFVTERRVTDWRVRDTRTGAIVTGSVKHTEERATEIADGLNRAHS